MDAVCFELGSDQEWHFDEEQLENGPEDGTQGMEQEIDIDRAVDNAREIDPVQEGGSSVFIGRAMVWVLGVSSPSSFG